MRYVDNKTEQQDNVRGAGPPRPSKRHPTDRIGPTELAEIVGGTWQVEPSPSWVLNRIQRMSNVGKYPRRGTIEPGTLAYTRNPKRFLARFERVTQGSDQVVLLIGDDATDISISSPVLRVPDSVQAADRLVRTHRESFDGPVIAVTGSMGKTTVTSMINTVLTHKHNVYSPRSDMNGIARIRARALSMTDEEFAVFEVPRAVLPGAEQFLRPDLVIITAIAEAHMEALGSLENTARTKAALLSGLTSEGTALINADAPYSDLLIEAARTHAKTIITYGLGPSADIRLTSYDPKTKTVIAEVFDSTYEYRMGLSGKHNAINSLAVLGTLFSLGFNIPDYVDGLSDFEPVQGRGKLSTVRFNEIEHTIVDQTFNANPASTAAAIEDFVEQYPDESRIIVLGDMLELGENEGVLHEQLAPIITKSNPEKVYLVGHLMTHAWKDLPHDIKGAHVITPEQLVAILRHDLIGNKAILLKASHGTGLSRVVDALSGQTKS